MGQLLRSIVDHAPPLLAKLIIATAKEAFDLIADKDRQIASLRTALAEEKAKYETYFGTDTRTIEMLRRVYDEASCEYAQGMGIAESCMAKRRTSTGTLHAEACGICIAKGEVQ